MIDGIELKHFRGFQDLSINGLARINIVVGQNGSGKTALLEAIYLACHSGIAEKIRTFCNQTLEHNQ